MIRRRSSIGLRSCLLVVPLLISARVVYAGCNIIPGTSTTFRSALGNVDRPFARPDDIVELRLLPGCDSASPGFAATAGENVVTVVFTPPNGPTDAVVLSEDCSSLDGQLQACGLAPGRCTTVNASGQPMGIQVFTASGERRLRFRFPDTDALVGAGSDDRTLSGPARIAVVSASAPFPCSLLSADCSSQTGLIACIDNLFQIDGTCGGTPGDTFSSFTALPPPNSYQALCFDPAPPCTGSASELHFTTDAVGNALIPMDWRGILVGQGVPIARLLRASSAFEAFFGTGLPVKVPGNAFLRSYSPEGGLLPPVFDPQSDPTATSEVTFFGSSDAPETVLRVMRRSPVFKQCSLGGNDGLPCIDGSECPGGTCAGTTCAGGGNDGNPCAADSGCPNGDCGPALFEFRDRFVNDVGPVVVSRFGTGVCQEGANAGQPCTGDNSCPCTLPQCVSGLSRCVTYRLAAKDPVPLDGISQTQEISTFVVSEGVEGQDLNGDGDATDDVVLLNDRQTGQLQAIGAAGTNGRAVVRVHEPPFSFPAVAVENDVVGFLESESAEADQDANGNGRVFDSIIRAFQLNGATTDLLSGADLAADATPLINHRSLVTSNGKVFFRTAESALAHQITTRVSLDPTGAEFPNGSDELYMPPSAGFVLFSETGGGPSGFYIRQLPNGPTTQLAQGGKISDDQRFMVNEQSPDVFPGTNRRPSEIFIYDRDSDENGVFDEPGGVSIQQLTHQDQCPDGTCLGSYRVKISGDGRFVAFTSDATNVVANDTDGTADIFLFDRVTSQMVLVALATLTADGPVGFSTDGRFLLLASAAALVPDDSGDTCIIGLPNGSDFVGCVDAFVYDRVLQTVEKVGVGNSGEKANANVFPQSISADGRFVVFDSYASNLVQGDTNGQQDVFIRDRLKSQTERASVNSAGEQGNLQSGEGVSSADGRYVAFESNASNLIAGDTDGQNQQIFLHDRLTGQTTCMSVSSTGAQGNTLPLHQQLSTQHISGDGSIVAFISPATNLVADDTNGNGNPDAPTFDAFLRSADPAETAADVTGDGDLRDTVLQVLDTSSLLVTPICPADAVAVADGRAVFLRAESAGATPALAGCPSGPSVNGNPDLNGDGDAVDDVVHLWSSSGGVVNLRCAATAVVLSDTYVAALVSEAGQGQDLNGDGDQLDNVVMVRRIADGDPGSCSGWTNTGQAADVVDIAGSLAAFLTPESAQGASGGSDLNSDGDKNDRVLQIYDAATEIPVRQTAENFVMSSHQAAEDFAMSAYMIAFRTREAAQGAVLNDDGDMTDDVLQIYDLISGDVINTKQAVTPCRLEACDPRVPYRVMNDTVKFLTLEVEQGVDLNGDGDTADLLLQTYNLRIAEQGSGGMPGTPHTTVGSVEAGICTNTAQACASDANCSGTCRMSLCTNTGTSCTADADCVGSCYVPPGGCILDLGNGCIPSIPGACPANQFCEPLLGSPGMGTCHEVQGSCQANADCTAPATCHNASKNIQRLVGPLTARGGVVFPSAGRCVEDLMSPCAQDSDCKSGEFCRDGSCHRQQSTCVADGDCAQGSQCEKAVLTAAARDRDGDEIDDPFDNCPDTPNITQDDTNHNGVGDACDLCGNGSIDVGEECDDGNVIDGDGCDNTCRLSPTATPAAAPPTPTVPIATPTRSPTDAVTATSTIMSPTATPVSCSGPVSGCRSAAKSVLILGRPGETKGRLAWKWIKGQSTSTQAFADPINTARYSLCVYSATSSQAAASATVAPGAATWSSLGTKGFMFWDAAATQSGIQKIKLKTGTRDDAKVLVKGRGGALPRANLPLQSPVRVQLINSDTGICWEATYQSADITKNDVGAFKAKVRR